MGSKNLKAIAVRGHSTVSFAEPEELGGIRADLSRRSLGDATEKYRTLGTMANVSVFNRLGALPTRNFQQSTFEGVETVSGEAFQKSHHVKNGPLRQLHNRVRAHPHNDRRRSEDHRSLGIPKLVCHGTARGRR